VSYAGGNWYTSSGFWTPASGVIATVAFGVLAVWVAWRVAYPKRRLYYSILADTSLLREGSVSGIEVLYNGRPVAKPRVMTVVLRNTGRHDITRDAFDGTPLRFDVSEHIVQCISVRTNPINQPRPKATTDGSALVIEPVKISKGETISVDLLIDGSRPGLRPPVQTLNDVQIQYQSTERRWTFLMFAAVAIILLENLLLPTVSTNSPRGHLLLLQQVAIPTFCGAAVVGLAWLMVATRRQR
jgi:hypothetical protein